MKRFLDAYQKFMDHLIERVNRCETLEGLDFIDEAFDAITALADDFIFRLKDEKEFTNEMAEAMDQRQEEYLKAFYAKQYELVGEKSK